MASRARWASLCSYLLLQCLLGLLATLLMRTERAPMPREDIAALARLVKGDSGAVPWPRASIEVSALAGAFAAQADLQAFVDSLAASLADDAHVSAASSPAPRLSRHTACAARADYSARACLDSLETQGGAGDTNDGGETLANTFELLVVPATGCPALLLDPGRGAVLRWAAPLQDPGDMAAEVAARLRETWLRRLHLEHAAALFEVAPAYVFSFFLVGDCRGRVAWDFSGGVLSPFLQRFLQRLGSLVDFEVDSQVVQCGSLAGPVGSLPEKLDAAALQADFLRHAGEWPGDTLTRAARWLPPLVRLVAFKPSAPLSVVDAQGHPQTSFAVQGWGAVAMTGDGDCEPSRCEGAASSGAGADLLKPCEAQRVASAWVSHLRSWLTLPPDAPLAGPPSDDARCAGGEGLALWAAQPRLDGITGWELLLAARAIHAFFVQRSAETLENFLALVDSLPEVVVRAEVAETYSQAAAGAQRAVSEAAAGKLEGALAAARRALALSLAISHDDTVVAAMYFSWEFKYAVYLPLMLPIAVPVFVALSRQARRARALRSLRLKGGAAEEVS